MRREFIDEIASRKGLFWAGMGLLRSFVVLCFRQLFRYLDTGSIGWHRTQEWLAGKSAFGIAVTLRAEFYKATLPACGEMLCVYPATTFCFPANIRIGRDVFINRGTYIVAPAAISIGNQVLIGPNVTINSGSHLYQDASKPIRHQGHKELPITIGDDVWIGAHAVILPGVTLGDGCVVGAGAVVTKSVPQHAVVIGVPAKIVGQRESK